jgi:TPR repeat protein
MPFMKSFLAAVFALFLMFCHAQAFAETSMTEQELIDLAEQGNPKAPKSLLKLYMAEKNTDFENIYYWAHVCLENLEKIGVFYAEADSAESKKMLKKYNDDGATGDYYDLFNAVNNGFLSANYMDCKAIQNEAGKNIDEKSLSDVKARIAVWHKAYPDKTPAQIAEQERLNRLSFRLDQELEHKYVDPKGIERIIKSGPENDESFYSQSLAAAIRNHRLDAIQMLLEKGGDLSKKLLIEGGDIENFNYFTLVFPLEYAVSTQNDNVIQFLINAGAEKKRVAGTEKYHPCPADLKACPSGQFVPRMGPSCGFVNCAAPDDKDFMGEIKDVSAAMPHAQIMALLKGQDVEKRAAAVEQVLSTPEKYNPVIFSAVSQALFRQYRDDDAALWQIISETRLAYYKLLCSGFVEKEAVPLLLDGYARHPTDFGRYSRQNVKDAEKIVDAALAMDRKIPYTKDISWIADKGKCHTVRDEERLKEDSRLIFAQQAKKYFGRPMQLSGDDIFPQDVENIQAKANAGDAKAEGVFADCYQDAGMCINMEKTKIPPAQFKSEAQKWYLKAAQHGNLYAMSQLADTKQAKAFLTKAIQQGECEAYLYMGTIAQDPIALGAWARLGEACGNISAKRLRIENEFKMSDQDLEKIRALSESYQKSHPFKGMKRDSLH